MESRRHCVKNSFDSQSTLRRPEKHGRTLARKKTQVRNGVKVRGVSTLQVHNMQYESKKKKKISVKQSKSLSFIQILCKKPWFLSPEFAFSLNQFNYKGSTQAVKQSRRQNYTFLGKYGSNDYTILFSGLNSKPILFKEIWMLCIFSFLWLLPINGCGGPTSISVAQ